MTFYFVKEENVLEGNVIGDFVEVDGSEMKIDVDGIMEEGRGTAKLREMQRQIDKAIIANEEVERAAAGESHEGDDNVDRSAAEAIDEAVEEM